MIEIWKPVKGFENYEVSNLGQVRNLNYHREKKIKILKLRMNKGGYLLVGLCKNSKKHTKLVHRLVAEAFIPNIDNKPEVNHLDGDKTNNKVENLEWSTRSENMKHAHNTGLIKPLTGENHPMYGIRITGENHPMYGKHLSDETKRKISETLKGKHTGKKHPMYGKHHTQKTKKKLSEVNKKTVVCVTTGEIFNSIKEAQEKYNTTHISKCCKGKAKSAGKNPVTGERLKWEYVEVVNYGNKTIRLRTKKDKEIIQ